jgi:serine/threonine-protein kinase
VGRGSFGDVYRARDTRLDRIVALKLLTQGDSAAPSDETVREARLLARVRHPNVVTVHGADRIEGRVGIWMEFLEGETLDEILRDRGPLDAREAALIGIDLCRALSAVHAAGITHQDVKLANVMRATGGRIVLTDFGLGRETRQTGRERTVSGTPLFMAPEVLRGARADSRSDVYSLGVVLFALVTGSQYVTASSLKSLIAKHERANCSGRAICGPTYRKASPMFSIGRWRTTPLSASPLPAKPSIRCCKRSGRPSRKWRTGPGSRAGDGRKPSL